MTQRLGGSFSRLLAGATISNVGDGMMGAAFPLLVAALSRDPSVVAGAAVAQRLPWLLFGILAGAVTDRLDRRKVMVLTDAVRAILVLLLTLAVSGHWVSVPLLYAIAFGLGAAETLFDTAADAMVPSLVADERLPAANARLQGVEWVGNAFVGPPIGAALFVMAAALPFGLNAASFVIAAILVWTIPGSYRGEPLAGAALREEITEGLRWLFRQRVLRSVALLAGASNFLTAMIVATFVLFAQDILGLGEVGFGLLLAAMGVGGLLGALLAPVAVDRLGSGTAAHASVALGTAMTLVVGMTSSPWVAGAGAGVFAASVMVWNVVCVSLRQSLTPDRLRGRVVGAIRLLVWGATPVGALVGGLTASAVGLRVPFALAAGGRLLVLLFTLGVVNNRTIGEARAAKAV